MKRVKMMLTAITVLAVVGGALAFKAKTTSFFVYQLNPGGQCHQLGVFDVGTTPLTDAFATIIDAGEQIDPSNCTTTILVSPE